MTSWSLSHNKPCADIYIFCELFKILCNKYFLQLWCMCLKRQNCIAHYVASFTISLKNLEMWKKLTEVIGWKVIFYLQHQRVVYTPPWSFCRIGKKTLLTWFMAHIRIEIFERKLKNDVHKEIIPKLSMPSFSLNSLLHLLVFKETRYLHNWSH